MFCPGVLAAVNDPQVVVPEFKVPLVVKLFAVRAPNVIALEVDAVPKLLFASMTNKL